MPTLAVLKSRIASEMERSDLTGAIANAISDAIEEYGKERFWFNESRNLTFSTVALQREYGAADASWIPNLVTVDALFVTIGGQVRDLGKENPAILELFNDSSTPSGQPYAWAVLDSNIILYPTPDQAYTVRAVAHYRLDALTDDTQSNAWTTEAERLIRRRAKQLLQMEVILDAEGAQMTEPLIGEALDSLRAETSRRAVLGRMRPSQF